MRYRDIAKAIRYRYFFALYIGDIDTLLRIKESYYECCEL